MTSSPSETIAKADRIWAYTNARGSRVWTPMKPAIAGAHEEEEFVRADLHAALARQVEAMKREMAEKDERIAALTGIDSAQDLVSDWLSASTDDLPDDTPVRIEIGNRTVIGDRLGSLRRARTLIQGEKQ